MEEKKETPETMTASDAIPGARFQDMRPTDIDLFYTLLPGVLSGFAHKSVDGRSANASAIIMVREMLGQCQAMGIMRSTIRCLDGSMLAILPTGMQVPGVPGVSGAVQQQPTQPGGGGMVSQYPNQPGTYGAGYAPQGQGQAQGPVPGQTRNIQPIMQFPNNAPPPQY
jgi:hypothetical protein